MNSAVSAALESWNLDPRVIAILLLTAVIYVRGWMRGRRLVLDDRDDNRLAAFLGGLAVLFLAIESPLDSVDALFLSAHMTQHLLLMMVAPPLLLLGHPVVPLLRGLPKKFVKEALAPFLTWPALRRVASFLVRPPVAWLAFAVSTIVWHLPRFYEMALGSGAWHATQHACFFWTGILFWWPVVQPGPGRNRWPAWMAIPYLLFADILNTAISAFFVFSGRLLYPSYAAVHAGGVNALQDQVLAGAIMWVPGSIIYILPAIAFTMQLVGGSHLRRTAHIVARRPPPSRPRFHIAASSLPTVRRVAQAIMLMVVIVVMGHGFFGPQVTPLNLAGILPWIHWRALSILALLVIGNLFCMACPFMLVRDLGRRIFPAKWRWPRRLRSKWLAASLLVLYLWAYEAFGLWDSPWLTAWIIAGYFTAAVIVDGFFRGASFCKYVCPIGQFHFVSSLVSPREVRVRSAAICKSCRTHDCIKGNDRARGCELYLFQPKKAGNLDCTFCMDCVKACPQDNVALLPTAPASSIVADPYRSSIGRLSKRTDVAALAALVVFGAFVNAAGMIAPVMHWEHSWHARLGLHAMPLIVGMFVLTGTVVLPLLAVVACATWSRVAGLRLSFSDTARRFVFVLVPLGVAMWAAHLLYHLATGWSAPLTIVQRLTATGFGTVPIPSLPAWLTGAQILLLDAGLLLTLYTGWRIGRQYADRLRTAVALLAPWAALSCALYAAGVCILLQPMQMRGMFH